MKASTSFVPPPPSSSAPPPLPFPKVNVEWLAFPPPPPPPPPTSPATPAQRDLDSERQQQQQQKVTSTSTLELGHPYVFHSSSQEMNASKAAAAAAEAGTEEEGDNLAGLMGIKSIFAVPLQEEEGTSPEARQIPRVTGAVANGSIALKKKTATAVVPVKSYDFDAQQGPTRSLFRNAILFPVSSITYATSRREPSVWNQVFLSLLSEGTKGFCLWTGSALKFASPSPHPWPRQHSINPSLSCCPHQHLLPECISIKLTDIDGCIQRIMRGGGSVYACFVEKEVMLYGLDRSKLLISPLFPSGELLPVSPPETPPRNNFPPPAAPPAPQHKQRKRPFVPQSPRTPDSGFDDHPDDEEVYDFTTAAARLRAKRQKSRSPSTPALSPSLVKDDQEEGGYSV